MELSYPRNSTSYDFSLKSEVSFTERRVRVGKRNERGSSKL